jgi:hypothetical protein
MAIGPVQMLVLGFEEPNFTGKIAAELDRLREHEFVKIVDALVVNKDDEGNVVALQVSDLSQDEATAMGQAGADRLRLRRRRGARGRRRGAGRSDGHLIPEEDAWYVADASNGSAAAIACSSISGRSRSRCDRRRQRHRSPTSGSTRDLIAVGLRQPGSGLARWVAAGSAAAPERLRPSNCRRHDRPAPSSS